MKRVSQVPCTSFGAGLLLALLIGALACGGETTSGRQVTLRTQAQVAPESGGAFVTDTGWTVRLSRAVVSIGALYYFDGEPAFARRPAPSFGRRMAALLGPSVAHAHPGHYLAGRALGQMTAPAFADLLAGPVMLPEGEGVTGRYRSARVVLAAPLGESARAALGTSVAAVEGVAQRGEQTVYFKLGADVVDVARGAREAQVEGCVFEEADVEDDGLVSVRIDPHVWLDLVDFAEVVPGNADAPTQVPRGHTAQLGFALGVAQLSAYRFSITH